MFSFDSFNIRTKSVERVSFYSVFLQGAFYPDEFIAPSWLGKDIRKGRLGGDSGQVREILRTAATVS